MSTLLPNQALSGMRIAISVSESPDLERLGLLEIHFRLALAEIARSVLVSAGTLAYGGHLNPSGYTAFLVQELQKYGRRDSPLLVCLAWQEHRKLSLSELRKSAADLGLLGRIVCLDPAGREVSFSHERGEQPEPVQDTELRKRALTAMRQYMAKHTSGRVFLGGKRHGFQGALPGLMEEALVSLDHNQPLFLAAGFGGVTADVARALRVDTGNWLVSHANAVADDPRWTLGYTRLADRAKQPGWAIPQNGLDTDENKRLAATHRPSDIAALVSLGLGRLRGPHN